MSQYAIIAIGGRGVRLGYRDAGDCPSKSLIPINGRPALFWTLAELLRAGIDDVTLCGESTVLLDAGAAIATAVGYRRERVHLFRDEGLGVHGIPGQLDNRPPSYFFVAGHAIVRASHFGRMREQSRDGAMVYSIFPTTAVGDLTTRTLVELDGTGRGLDDFRTDFPGNTPWKSPFVLSFPYLLNDRYVPLLSTHSWSIAETIKDPQWRRSCKYVLSSDVPEFDVPSDLISYRRWIRTRHIGALLSNLGSSSPNLARAWSAFSI